MNLVSSYLAANIGVGFQTAKALLLQSANIHAMIGSEYRRMGISATEELRQILEAKGTVGAVQLDLTDRASMLGATLLRANVVGPAHLTCLSLELLRHSKKPRLVFITIHRASRKLDIGNEDMKQAFESDEEGPHAWYRTTVSAYRISKAAPYMLLVQYHISKDGLTVLGVDPRSREEEEEEDEKGGTFTAAIILGEKDDEPGLIHSRDGVVPW
ncbi:hypothetical protein BJX70DRAFT_395226 [Aspergillus crustosus]